jgi:hypothetical protein
VATANKPKYIVIHHSHTKDGETLDFNAIRKYHLDKGWRDIGYHFVIENYQGDIITKRGRPTDDPGAHAVEFGMNRKSVGICVVGNYDEAAPPLGYISLLKKLCMAIIVNYTIPVEHVIGHRDVGLMAGFDWQKVGPTGIPQYKSCPGKYFPLGTLRDMLRGTLHDF